MEPDGSKFWGISKKVIREELSEIDAADIMVVWSQVVMLDVDSSFQEIIRIITDDGHSRFPVFSKKVDNIIGLLYAKDLLNLFKDKYILQNKNNILADNFDISTILRKPLFVSENKKADELLGEFRDSHIHLAIVVDEHGTVSGIITLEDILEEIVGEISDEFEKEEVSSYKYISDNKYSILPIMTIELFNTVFKTKIKSNDFETIGGFIIDRFGYVPQEGESLVFKNYLFRINKVEGSKLQEISLERV